MQIGILHPGSMGSAVGAVARLGGAAVVWASEGRSPATAARAARDGLRDVGSLQALVATSDVILSICPPDQALNVARQVATCGFTGLYVDANAVAPATARAVEAAFASASPSAGALSVGGAEVVDGGIVGGPPREAGRTWLYLSGRHAAQIADLFDGTPLRTAVLDGGIGAASAMKVCYAAWTKGTTALLLAIRALAEAEGVEAALLDQWELSQPAVLRRSEQAPGSAGRAWRWVGEMEEIADAFAAAGLPGGFHLAAAEIYRRLAGFKDGAAPPALAEMVAQVRAASGARGA